MIDELDSRSIISWENVEDRKVMITICMVSHRRDVVTTHAFFFLSWYLDAAFKGSLKTLLLSSVHVL